MSQKLFAQLRALGKLDPSPEPIAEAIADRAKELAPVDTGELRDGIHAERDAVVSDAPHSIHVEFGTRFMRAQPFMRPAIDEREAELLKIAGKAVMDEIRRVI